MKKLMIGLLMTVIVFDSITASEHELEKIDFKMRSLAKIMEKRDLEFQIVRSARRSFEDVKHEIEAKTILTASLLMYPNIS